MRFYTNVQMSGDNILIREVVNGKRKKRKEQYNPTLYVPSSKKTLFKTLQGDYVEPIKPGSINETRGWIKDYNDVSGFEIFGQTAYQYAWIADQFPEETVEYDIKDICTVSLDIECESERGFPSPETATERVNAITIRDMQHKKTYTFGLGKGYITDNPQVTYLQFDTEEELLTQFINTWRSIDPDIVTGWSISFFDIPYLVNRIKKLLGEDEAKRLSPWNRLREIVVAFMNKDVSSYEISGISIIDYLTIYKKYTFASRENYQLGYISQIELGKTKVDHTEYDSMSLFYKNDWEKFITYNIEDALLVEELEQKLKLIDLTLMVAYQAHINYGDVISQVRTWDTIIYNYLKRDNIVIPQKKYTSKDTQYAGAYVKEPVPGLRKWVVSFDVTSLYPSIIRCLNIGTETKMNDILWSPYGPQALLDKKEEFIAALDVAKDSNWTVAVNGIHYTRSRISFYSRMIEKLFNDRVEYRKAGKKAKEIGDMDTAAKYDIKQQATKIQMNSLYGAMGNQYFRFFDVQNAEAVTLTGQFIIQYIERGINDYLNKAFASKDKTYVIYSDTDSIYLTLDEIVNKVFPDQSDIKKIIAFLNKVSVDKIEPELDRLFKEITEKYLNGMPGHLKMKREVIANKAIWTGKKRYILNVFDDEGEILDKPKLKVQGIEIKKSTVPRFCKTKMEQAVKIIMDVGDNDVLIEFIEAAREEFNKLPVEDVSFPRGVSGLQKYANVDKSVPLHTRGALLYNSFIDTLNLSMKYQKIMEGEKIKYVYLKVPNPTKDKVIGFLTKLPVEFKLEQYVDYDVQFSKSFIEPLNAILKVIGWDWEKKTSLCRFF